MPYDPYTCTHLQHREPSRETNVWSSGCHQRSRANELDRLGGVIRDLGVVELDALEMSMQGRLLTMNEGHGCVGWM